MLPGRKYRPEDLLRIAWRRKWLIATPFVVLASATAMFSRGLPNKYRSETLILVVPQRVPESYVRSTVTMRIEDRLQALRQEILSRNRLERIITDFGMYRDERRMMLMEDVVARMRANIEVDTVRGDAFSVSFESPDPRMAQKVTERLAALFIDENVREREVLAVGTSNFLHTQLEEARGRLIEQEKKLEAYRLRYAGELPSQAASNLQALQAIRQQRQGLADALNRDRERRLMLERQMTELPPVETPATPPPPSAAAAAGSDDPAALAGATPDEKLRNGKSRLAELSMRLTPEHPDIVRLKRAVERLEQRVATDPPAPAVPPTLATAERLRDRRAAGLRADIENLDRQIALKVEEDGRLSEQAEMYQARFEAAPIRESELTELTRDYETTQELYRALLAKREDSKIAANLEKRQVGEQFRVLDPPRVPQRPVSPNRAQINLAGALAGLLLGLGIAGLLEYLDSSINTEEDVRVCLSLPVLAIVPVVGRASWARSRRSWRAWPARKRA